MQADEKKTVLKRKAEDLGLQTSIIRGQDPDFGIIFHWGLYSVPAYDDPSSARRRNIQNGSEWYAKRLWTAESETRSVSGAMQTKLHHAKNFPGKRYNDFAYLFPPKDWNPDTWMQLCRDCGASYVILTAKHHDGYCLWPTRANTGGCSPVDLVGRFKESAEKFGLTFGVYYSWGEFASPVNKAYIAKIVVPQINDLIRYGPKIWWFDGSWWFRSVAQVEAIRACCRTIRSHIPKAIFNDRLGIKYADINDLGGLATYRVYADRSIPAVKPVVPWEHINTIGLSWGRNKQQTPQHYKSGTRLLELYSTTRTLGGKFLLNLGPDADGSLDPKEIASLLDFSRLLNPPNDPVNLHQSI